MEVRIAKLESDVEYIKRDITDIKSDLKDIRKDAKDTLAEISSLKVWALTFYVAGFAGLLFVMAKGFKWL